MLRKRIRDSDVRVAVARLEGQSPRSPPYPASLMATSDRKMREAAKKATRRYSQALGNLGRAWDGLHEAEYHGAARPESPAAQDASYLGEKCGDFYDDPGGSIGALVSGRMSVAVDHLQGTGHLYLAKNTGIFSVWATGRSFFEMLGTVFWLTEPEISAEFRLGRVINDRLISLRGSQKFIEKGLVREEDIKVDPTKRAADLLDRSTKMGYEVVKTSSGKQVDPERPSLTDLVDGLIAGGLYSLCSAMSHGEIWAITHHQRMAEEVSDPSGQDRELSQIHVSVEEYQALANFLQTALGKTVNRVATYFGWDDSEFAKAFDRARDDLRRGPMTDRLLTDG